MRILVADDNELVRRGIVRLLASQPSLELCGEASNGEDVIHKAVELRPDVILLDVSMPGTSGLEAAHILKNKLPTVKILIISQHDPQQMLSRCIEMGAIGCIDKGRLATDLLPSIKKLEKTSFRQTA
jgi:DNA-binding NarL/FixJ family response regulator